jgi:hypothetical protein
MVIRVQRFNDAGSEFIRVDFSLPCDKSPEWVSAKPSIQRFRLFRQKDCDAVLVGSMAGERQHEPALQTWKHPPGTQQVVPCYRSIDLPLVPVV